MIWFLLEICTGFHALLIHISVPCEITLIFICRKPTFPDKPGISVAWINEPLTRIIKKNGFISYAATLQRGYSSAQELHGLWKQ
jgi:hypothetical protein